MAESIVGLKIQIGGQEKVLTSMGDIKKTIKDLQFQLLAVTQEFGASSEEAIRLAKQIEGLKDNMADAKSMTDAFNPDAKFKAFSQTLQGVAGGFAVVQGAMGLMGSESEDLQKTLLKVQSALALSEGLNTFLDTGIQGLKNMKAVAIDAFKGIKTAIGSTGIGLLVVALGTIVAYWDDIKRAVSGVSKAQEDVYNKAKLNSNVEKEKVDNLNKQDNILKLQGKTEKEILNLKIAQTDQAIFAFEAQLKAQTAMQDAQYKTAKRNREILEGVLRWLQIPLTAILGSIDLIGKAFGKDFGLEKAFIGWEASFLIDPKEIKDNGEKANKEVEKQLADLRNTQAGYKLAIKEIDKKDADERKEKAKKASDDAKEKAKKDAEERNRVLEESNKIIAEKDKTAKEKELYELDLKYKEDLKLFKDGTAEKAKVQEAFGIEKQAIIDKYAKIEAEEKKKKDEEQFQLDKSKLDQVINDEKTKFDVLVESVDKEKELLQKALDEKLISEKDYNEKIYELNDRIAKKKEGDIKKEKELEQARIKEGLDLAMGYADSAGKLSDALYASKLEGVEKGSKEEEKILRQQFETNKKIQIAQTIISGLNGVVNALSAKSVIPEPFGAIARGVNAGFIVATTGATISKIAQQQYKSTSSNLGNAGGSSPAPVSPSTPVQQTITTLNQGSINALGNQAIKAYVVETDIRNSQTRVNRILTNSKFK